LKCWEGNRPDPRCASHSAKRCKAAGDLYSGVSPEAGDVPLKKVRSLRIAATISSLLNQTKFSEYDGQAYGGLFDLKRHDRLIADIVHAVTQSPE